MKTNPICRLMFLHFVIILLTTITKHTIAQSDSLNESELFLINNSPSCLQNIDLQGQLPSNMLILDKNPTMAFLGPQGNSIFILHNGWPANTTDVEWKKIKQPSSISIINTKNLSLIRKIQLGWEVTNMYFSSDSNFLLVLGRGKQHLGKLKSDSELGNITLINTQTGNVEFSVSKWRWIQNIAFTKDFSQIAVLGVNNFNYGTKIKISTDLQYYQLNKKNLSPKNHVITTLNKKGEIINQIELPDWERPEISKFFELRLQFSDDEKWLYVFDPGEKTKETDHYRTSGVIMINCSNGKIDKSVDFGYNPFIIKEPYNKNDLLASYTSPKNDSMQLSFLFGNNISETKLIIPASYLFIPVFESDGFYAIGKHYIYFVSEKLDTSYQIIAYREPKVNLPVFDNIITNALYLIKSKQVVVFTAAEEYGIFNAQSHELLYDGEIGSDMARGAIALGQFIQTATMFASFAIPGPLYFTSVLLYSPVAIYDNILSVSPIVYYAAGNLIISPDERFIYAYDTYTNDITIIDRNTGKIIDYIPAGKGYKGMILAPDCKYIWVLSDSRLQIIEMNNNRIIAEFKNKTELGEISGITYIGSMKSLAIMYDKTLQIWDMENRKNIKTITVLSKPKFILTHYFK